MTFDDVQQESPEEWDEPSRPHRKKRHAYFDAEAEVVRVDLEIDLPGAIYEVPDKMWGIEAPGREWHPGICIYSGCKANEALLIKGTSQSLVGDLSRYFLLDPCSANGLKLPTAFNLMEIHSFPRSKVALLHFGRLLGRLGREELIRLQEELMYLGTRAAV